MYTLSSFLKIRLTYLEGVSIIKIETEKDTVEKANGIIKMLSYKQPVQQNSFYYWFSPPA